MDEQQQNDETTTPATAPERRARKREWLAQVDFWEGVKEFILKRIPSSARRPIDQLY